MGGAATLPQLIPHCHQTSSSHGAERRSCPFPEGSLVEVRTHEADFKDTFFSATVIPPDAVSPKKGSRRKSRRVSVEYHSLYEEEDGSELLKENVSISCVRPFPALQEIVEGYELNDAVDAFYQEGWWIGTVTQVLEGEERRYVVTFQNPPDELQFGFSELRVHWDWVKGSWVRPERQSIARFMFDVGRKVEVSFHRKDCQVAWFPATINQDLGNGSYLVEYRSAISDDEVQTAKVEVDSLHLRPCPPLLKVNNFVILEKVDALFDLGWWSGVINKVLENSRYMVFFKSMNMEREFQQSELRSHMDWKNGKWFTSSQSSQDVTIPSSDGGTHESHTCENSSVSVPTVPVKNLVGNDTFDGKTSSSLTSGNGNVGQLTPDSRKASQVTSLTKRRRQHLSDSGNGHVGQLTPDSREASHVTSLTKRRRQHLSDSRNALSLSVKKFKGTVLRTNQQEIDDMTIKEMLSDSVSPVSGNNGESTGKQSATGDYSFDNPSWGKRTQRRQRDFGGKINLKPSYMKNSSAQMTQVENLELDAGGKDPDVVDKTAEDVRKERSKKGIVVPVVIGLPCAEMVNSGFGNLGGKSSRGSNSKENVNTVSQEKKQSHDSIIQTIEDIKLLELGESRERRKRGRPRKTMTESIQTLVTDDLNKKDDAPDETPEVVAVGMDTSSPIQEMTLNKEQPTNGQSDPKDRIGTMTKRTSPRKHGEKVVKESVGPEESRVLNRGRRQNTSETVALQVPDFLGASGGELVEVNNSTLEVHIVVCETETPSNEFENQPLSKWIVGRHSPSLVDGSIASAVVAADQSIENGDKQKNNVVLEEVSAKHQECENQRLPFVKNNAFIWKTIESMEVFQKTPQNPHFLPLEHCKESLREGKAIALMVNFSCVVEKTSKLQWNDPKSVADDILEIVVELEEHGFNVSGVRDRVVEFVAAKDREEKLVNEVKGLNDEIIDEKCKKDKIEGEMKDINQQIQKLQEKLSVLESAKGIEEDKIGSLVARLKETEGVIEILRRAFEGDQGIVSSALS